MTDRPSGPPPFDAQPIQAIVFDLDGTLIDSYEAIAGSLNHARAHFGLPALDPALVRREVGHGLESLIADLVGPDRVDAGVRLFRERYTEVWGAGTRALPGAADALGQLRAAGYRLAVASNKPAHFSRLILEGLGLLGPIDSVRGPDGNTPPKPDPAMIWGCLAELGITPAHSVYVGDMVLDIESARRARLPVVLVAGGSVAEDELRSTGQVVVADLRHLRRLFPGPTRD